ncbi:NUDIX domain-containing protein [Gordonia oryzae]|uniref:NUDIX domain-containing protein n=1 Tax=Gordonia oryzae TaxID=2487349 RepID=A0A3N4GGX0_9ACTN|nr:NUDIX domain-containing protein [Gordonia oryzae]RPA57850.1 NUDIX domain-containing protein [Gordonia oryzae]
MTDDRVITVSAVVLRDESGALLVVRKVGSSRFMLPGGKPEPGEDPRTTAIRECVEEIGVQLPGEDLTELGTFTAAAANEAGFAVRATVFEYRRVVRHATAAAEIAELRWLPLDDAGSTHTANTSVPLAPLLVEHVIPALRGRDRASGGDDSLNRCRSSTRT